MYGYMQVIAYLTIIIWGVYYYYTTIFEHWKKRGVKGPTPTFFFGNFKDVYLGRISMLDYITKLYYEYHDEPMIGLFNMNQPYLLIKDPEYIKDVFIKDFTNFPDRNVLPNERVEPLSPHLFRLEESRWRPLRNRLSPAFASGKLKEMFHLLLECSEQFERYLDEQVAKGEPIECRELTAKFTTDVIGSCAFGIEMNAISMENSEFRKMGKKITKPNWKTFIKDRIIDNSFLFNTIGSFFVDDHVTKFFTRMTKDVIDYRIRHNLRRHDFMDALVELKLHPENLGFNELSDTFFAAQTYVFFTAGFGASSATITHSLYELALNQDIQKKLREDVKNVLENTNGKITYESIKEMKYLQRFVQEILRKYPPAMYIGRAASSDYTFKGSNVRILKGQKVFIPVYVIHYDPDIYPEPEVFNPERFNEENIGYRHPMHYLPFGEGPRKCIATRFANYQTKMGIIAILLSHQIDVCEKTEMPYVCDPKCAPVMQPNHDIHLQITKIKKIINET